MKGNVCGNCRNFKPKPGRKFFNCTKARHAGAKYGMQVRADTRECDAFVPAEVPPTGERAQPAGFWRRRRALLLIALLIAIPLISWAIYSSAATPTKPASPGTTPVSGNVTTPTPAATPTPARTPGVIVKYFDIGAGQQAVSPEQMVTVARVQRVASYQLLTKQIVRAPLGMEFVRIYVSCTNLGDTQFSVSQRDFTLTDSEGKAYTPYADDDYYVGRPYPDRPLPPGESAEGTVFWIVPKTVSGLEVSYLLDSTSTPRVIAKWKLP